MVRNVKGLKMATREDEIWDRLKLGNKLSKKKTTKRTSSGKWAKSVRKKG